MMRVDAGVVGAGLALEGTSIGQAADTERFAQALRDAETRPDEHEPSVRARKEQEHARSDEDEQTGDDEREERARHDTGVVLRWMFDVSVAGRTPESVELAAAQPGKGAVALEAVSAAPDEAATEHMAPSLTLKRQQLPGLLARTSAGGAEKQGGPKARIAPSPGDVETTKQLARNVADPVVKAALVEQLSDVTRVKGGALPEAAAFVVSARGTHDVTTILRSLRHRHEANAELAGVGAASLRDGIAARAAASVQAVQSVPKAHDVQAWGPQLRLRVAGAGGEASMELELADGTRARLDVRVTDGRLDARVWGADPRHRVEVDQLLDAVRTIARDTGLEAGDFASHERDRDGAAAARAVREHDEGVVMVDEPAPRMRPVHTGLVDLVV